MDHLKTSNQLSLLVRNHPQTWVEPFQRLWRSLSQVNRFLWSSFQGLGGYSEKQTESKVHERNSEHNSKFYMISKFYWIPFQCSIIQQQIITRAVLYNSTFKNAFCHLERGQFLLNEQFNILCLDLENFIEFKLSHAYFKV